MKKTVLFVAAFLIFFTVFSILPGQHKTGIPSDNSASLSPQAIKTAGTGAISGRVTDLSNNGLNNVTITVQTQFGAVAGTALSDASGNYTVTMLAAGNYNVLFGEISGYIWEYYNDKHSFATADAVIVSDEATTSNINAQLAAIPTDPYEPNNDMASAIELTPGTYNNLVIDGSNSDYDWFKIYVEEGQDLSVATSNPLSLYAQYDDIDFGLYNGSGELLAEAITPKGNEILYLADMPAGWYYISIFYGAGVTYSLTLTTGDLNIGVITGKVINSLASGVQNVFAYLYPANSASFYSLCAVIPTDAAGNLRIAYSPGAYKIDLEIDNYVEASDIYVMPEWYNDKATFDDASVVTIQADQTTPLAVTQLADGAAVSGQLTDNIGNPVYFGKVNLYRTDGSRAYSGTYYNFAWTDTSGNYTIKHIAIGDGTCKASFLKSMFATEWYNDKISFAYADPVSLQPRKMTTGISAQLALMGKIIGRVTDASNNGLQNVTVLGYDTIQSTVPSSGYSWTNSNGEYTLGPFPTMNVRVYFDTGNASLYQSEYYNNKFTFSSADSVSVTSGQTTPNIDAQLGLKPIIVTSPNGGESWTGGSFHTITWTSSNPSVNGVWVNYSTDNGASWKAISLTTDDGSMPWVVPKILSNTCLVQVTLGLSPYPGDISDAVFTITAAPKDDFLGTWDGQGVYFRNSETGKYVKLSSSADLIVAGDLDNDGKDDLVGIWPGQGGVWVRYSSTGAWAKLSSTAKHIAAGDMNGDGRTDLLGTWDGQGVYYRNSANGLWIKLASPATLLTTGNLDSGHGDDVIDDLIGIWPTQGGVWVKYSRTSAWSKLSSTAKDIAAGDMNGDGMDDLLATYDGQGVFYRNSYNGSWVKMATPADQVTCGDLDGDGKDDLIGIWPGQGGVWVKYSKTGSWSKISSTAKDIAAGVMRGAIWGSSRSGFIELQEPVGGYVEGPEGQSGFKDTADEGPGGRTFAAQEGKNLIPQESAAKMAAPGPGDPGFVCIEQENLVPQEQEKSVTQKRDRTGEHKTKRKKIN